MFMLVSRRYERASLIVTSNKPFSAWGEIFGDEIVAAAMIDRLVHHAEVISLKGDSYRLKDRDLGRTPVGIVGVGGGQVFVLDWRTVTQGAVEPVVVVPVHPVEGRQLEIVDATPGPLRPDAFGFVQADKALRLRIVVGIPNATYGCDRASVGKCCAVTDRRIRKRCGSSNAASPTSYTPRYEPTNRDTNSDQPLERGGRDSPTC
jgi:hypothetical protein